ncbi:hypothetical protein CGA22_18295 [Pseudomonas sp. PSB18]|nr:hypothetical protein [Pseudomonas sp. PSB18]
MISCAKLASSADLNANHCSSTYANARASLRRCASIQAVLVLSRAVWLARTEINNNALLKQLLLWNSLELHLQAIGVPEEHFNRALERYFKAEKR